jgi:hypothetical protein
MFIEREGSAAPRYLRGSLVPKVFHSMEKYFAIFPRYGKNVSTLWKKEAVFSTQWKNFSPFFHTMERICPQCGKLCFRAVSGGFRAVLRGC